MNNFKLPYKIGVTLGKSKKIIFTLGILSTSFFMFFAIIAYIEDGLMQGLKIGTMPIILMISFIYMVFFFEKNKKLYIEVTNDYFKYSNIVKERIIKWEEIYSAHINEDYNGEYIGIILIKDVEDMVSRKYLKKSLIVKIPIKLFNWNDVCKVFQIMEERSMAIRMEKNINVEHLDELCKGKFIE